MSTRMANDRLYLLCDRLHAGVQSPGSSLGSLNRPPGSLAHNCSESEYWLLSRIAPRVGEINGSSKIRAAPQSSAIGYPSVSSKRSDRNRNVSWHRIDANNSRSIRNGSAGEVLYY